VSLTSPAHTPTEGVYAVPAQPWPPRAACPVTARKPVGGFVFRTPEQLLLPWLAYQAGELSALALRGVFAVAEMQARRCQLAPDAAPHYRLPELGALLALPPARRQRRAQAVQQALCASGLLTWDAHTLALTRDPTRLPWLDAQRYRALRAQVPPGQGRVPVPRHLGQYLARAGSPGLIATAIGVVLHCLRYRDRQCVSGGRVTAARLATTLGLARRRVQRHLDELTALGWLATMPEETTPDPRGPWRLIHLAWDFPRLRAVPPAIRPTPPRPRRPQQLELFPLHLMPSTPAACPAGAPALGRDTPLPAAVFAAHQTAASARLTAAGVPAFCHIRPVLEVEIGRWLAEAAAPLPTPVPTPRPAPVPAEEPEARPTLAHTPRPTLTHIHAESINDNLSFLPSTSLQPFQEILSPEDNPAGPPPTGVWHSTVSPTLLSPPSLLLANTAPLPDGLSFPRMESHTADDAALRAAIGASLLQAAAAAPTRPPNDPPASPPPAMPLATSHAPRLTQVTLADLQDTGRLLQLVPQAQARGLLTGAHPTLTLVTLAEHALRLRARYDPCRLFGALLYDPAKRRLLTDGEEDAARQRLRAWDTAHRPAAPPPLPMDLAAWSDDALLLEGLLAEGPALWGTDPRAWLLAQDSSWTAARWEQAVLEHARLHQRLRQATAPPALQELDDGLPPLWHIAVDPLDREDADDS